MIPRSFNYTIDILDIRLDVSGTFYPGEPATRIDPPEGSLVELEAVYVSGSDVNIKDLIDADTLERIENKIDRIESAI